MENEDPEQIKPNHQLRVYKYRWIIISIFGLYVGINFFQFMQFTIIADVVTKYYQVDSFLIDLSGLVFMIVYLVAFIPAAYVINRFSIKTIAVFSSGLTAIACLLKLLAVAPDRIYVVLITQSLCGLAQVFMISIPSKVAGTWFGPDEVSTACGIAVFGTQLGLALGCLIPPFAVTDDSNNEQIEKGLFNMLIYNAAIASGVFLLVLLFFKSRPPLPPSHSQALLITIAEEELTYGAAFKKLIKNKDFLLISFAYGTSFGMWNCFGILINPIYLHYFPDGRTDVGIITLIAIIAGGCFGTVIFGLILDKTKAFKKVSFLVLLAGCLTFLIFMVMLEMHSRVGSYIGIPLFAFFSASGMIMSFEYTIEATYPIPEAFGTSILNAVVYLFAIIFVLILETLFDMIGYLESSILILIVLCVSTCSICFMSNNLRRRDANLQIWQDTTHL